MSDIAIDYRKIMVKAGWNLFEDTAVTSIYTTLISQSDYYDTSKPTSSEFDSVVVDFNNFNIPEPEPLLIDAALATLTATATTAALLLSLF